MVYLFCKKPKLLKIDEFVDTGLVSEMDESKVPVDHGIDRDKGWLKKTILLQC